MVSRNGSASEDLNRWRSAGFFPERRFKSMRPVWTAESPSGGDPGRGHSEGRAQGYDWIRGRAILEVVPGPPLCLKHHEPLPVGRARPKLGPVRSRYSGRNHPSHGPRQALLRAILPQAYGSGLGLPESGICPGDGRNHGRDWKDRSLLAEA